MALDRQYYPDDIGTHNTRQFGDTSPYSVAEYTVTLRAVQDEDGTLFITSSQVSVEHRSVALTTDMLPAFPQDLFESMNIFTLEQTNNLLGNATRSVRGEVLSPLREELLRQLLLQYLEQKRLSGSVGASEIVITEEPQSENESISK